MPARSRDFSVKLDMRLPPEHLGNILDAQANLLYEEVMKRISQTRRSSVSATFLAAHFGVDVSEVTPEFVEQKQAEIAARDLKRIRDRARERGVKLKIETPLQQKRAANRALQTLKTGKKRP